MTNSTAVRAAEKPAKKHKHHIQETRSDKRFNMIVLTLVIIITIVIFYPLYFAEIAHVIAGKAA